MENKEISFQQFVRNLNENKLAQKYFKSRGLSKSIVQDKLIGFCPTYSRYSWDMGPANCAFNISQPPIT